MSRGRGRFVLGVCLRGLRCRGSGINAAVLETDFGRGAVHVQALRVCGGCVGRHGSLGRSRVGLKVSVVSLWGRAGGFAGHFGAPTFERHLNRKPGPGAQGLEKPEARGIELKMGGAWRSQAPGVYWSCGAGWQRVEGRSLRGRRDAAVSSVAKPTRGSSKAVRGVGGAGAFLERKGWSRKPAASV